MNAQALIDAITFDDDGLVLAIAQDAISKDVLMVAYMNERTVRQTLDTGQMTYWSRSRQQVWTKGETSGHIQQVRSVRIDWVMRPATPGIGRASIAAWTTAPSSMRANKYSIRTTSMGKSVRRFIGLVG